jgi:hypothetical protein
MTFRKMPFENSGEFALISEHIRTRDFARGTADRGLCAEAAVSAIEAAADPAHPSRWNEVHL